MTRRLWLSFPFMGGPRDGSVARYKKDAAPAVRFFGDPGLEETTQPGDRVHVYELWKRSDGGEFYQYVGARVREV